MCVENSPNLPYLIILHSQVQNTLETPAYVALARKAGFTASASLVFGWAVLEWTGLIMKKGSKGVSADEESVAIAFIVLHVISVCARAPQSSLPTQHIFGLPFHPL